MSKLITCIVLTLPVVPRDRWFICCVIGPIMLAGCMDIVWSMVGVITAPWWRTWTRRKGPKKGTAYDLLIWYDLFSRIVTTIKAERNQTLVQFHNQGRPVQNLSQLPQSFITLFYTVLWNIRHSGKNMCNRSLFVADEYIFTVYCTITRFTVPYLL